MCYQGTLFRARAHMFRLMGFAAIFNCKHHLSERGFDKTLGRILPRSAQRVWTGCSSLGERCRVAAAKIRNFLTPARPASASAHRSMAMWGSVILGANPDACPFPTPPSAFSPPLQPFPLPGDSAGFT